MDLKAKTWGIVSRDRFVLDYPERRLNYQGYLHLRVYECVDAAVREAIARLIAQVQLKC